MVAASNGAAVISDIKADVASVADAQEKIKSDVATIIEKLTMVESVVNSTCPRGGPRVHRTRAAQGGMTLSSSAGALPLAALPVQPYSQDILASPGTNDHPPGLGFHPGQAGAGADC